MSGGSSESREASGPEVWDAAATVDAAIRAEVRAAVSAAGEVRSDADGEDGRPGAADLEQTMVVKYVPVPGLVEPAGAAPVAAAKPEPATMPEPAMPPTPPVISIHLASSSTKC